MSEGSERTLLLLQELAVLKQVRHKKGKANSGKRRKEISDEINHLRLRKKSRVLGKDGFF